ncbi:MAG: ABC transporter substrate-binding protein [Bacilli bacterium]|nr:ABC transporter substrate-binding protein [Bacilli bacterium]
MKKLFSLLVVLLLVCSVAGCKEKEAETIKIGSSGPLSGSVSIYGLAVKEGVELAIEEINAAGGVNVDGTMMKLELVDFVNDEADAKKAAAALTSLISKDVDVVVGAVTSGATEGLIAEAVKHGVPVITPTGTADKLTIGDNGDERDVRYNVFRACFYDSYQGKFMGEYAAQEGVKKAYVLYNNDEDYSKGLKDAFVTAATAGNVEVVTAAYSKQDKDFNAFWVPILEGGYDCVYVPDYYENVYNILKTGYAKGYTGVCYGGDGWDGVIKQVKEGEDASFLENCYYTNHYFGESESPAVKTFVEKYQAKYGSIPVSFAALGYDAVYIAKQAIEACDSLEYDAVVEALTTGTFSGLVTSSTPFTFNNGNPEKAAVVITFKDGKEVEAE